MTDQALAKRSRDLAVYLNDHLAGSAAGCRLAKRLAQGASEHQPVLAAVRTEIEEDRRALEEVMRQLGVERSRTKAGLARLLEVGSRIKLSAPFAGDKGVSDLLAVETLALGILGKQRLWTALRSLERSTLPVSDQQLDDLIVRAQHQYDSVEGVRMQVARGVLQRS